jgi:hypothetical protein
VFWRFVARRTGIATLLFGFLLIVSLEGALAQPGTQAQVTGTGGEGLILRSEARSGATMLAVEPEGAVVTIIGPEQNISGRTWFPVRDAQGRTGWLAGEYLTPYQPTVTARTDPPPPGVSESSPPPDPESVPESEPEPTTPPRTQSVARRTEEPGESEPQKGADLTLEVRFKLPEIDRRDRQTIYVDVSRNSQPVPDVIVRFTVDDEDPEVEREARVTNSQGRSTHEWSMRKYRGTTVVRVVATAPDGGTGKASRSFFVK